ncbi:MAG: hypothetical protein R3281_10050 [Balneolaceae bacterium]|nr:hypothetical protein [Balneolaceae bacterium]
MRRYRSPEFWLLLLACGLGVILFTHDVFLSITYEMESWNPENLPGNWQRYRTIRIEANHTRTAAATISFLCSLLAFTLANSKDNPG